MKNTGGEDINAIQDQLQKNKKGMTIWCHYKMNKVISEKKIEESIEQFYW